MRVSPLENFSSLHEFSFFELFGWNIRWPGEHFVMQFSLNLHTPLKMHPRACVTLDTRDVDAPPSAEDCCYSITGLKSWRLDISSYGSLDDYLDTTLRWHRCNYSKSKKKFLNYGCTITLIEREWTEHAERVNHLYSNVAKRYQHKMYNLQYFQEIAKRPDYKLLCAWFEGEMIGVFVLQEELPTLHSVLSGLDYHHSSISYAYSWMSYVLLDYAIALQKYQNVDVGFNSDKAKRMVGFRPILSRIDIYSKGRVTRQLFKMISRFVSATITADAKLKLNWRNRRF